MIVKSELHTIEKLEGEDTMEDEPTQEVTKSGVESLEGNDKYVTETMARSLELAEIALEEYRYHQQGNTVGETSFAIIATAIYNSMISESMKH